MGFQNPMKTMSEQHAYCAWQNGVITQDQQLEWIRYLDGLTPVAAASAGVALLTGRVEEPAADGWFGSEPVAARLPSQPPPPAPRPVAASSRVSSSMTPPVQQVQLVAPRSGAEAAAALGPRPGSEWFNGYGASAQVIADQVVWDATVAASTTYEETVEVEVAWLMTTRGGMTEAQARAAHAARADSGPKAL